MSDVISFDPGDNFIFRTFKYLTSNPSLPWSNAYEVTATNEGTILQLQALADALGAFESALYADVVQIPRVVVSTWEPDSHPYNPETLFVRELYNVMGTREVADLLPLRVTLQVQRACLYGRSGRLYLRGVLGESMVNQFGGNWALTSPVVVQQLVSDALTESGLAGYLSGGQGELAIACIAWKPNMSSVVIRQVTNFVAHNVADVQMNHRWYNREIPT